MIVILLNPVINVRAVTASAPITVNTTLDDYGSDLTLCSLREAIQSINVGLSFGGCSNPGGLTDTVMVPAGVYTLTITGSSGNPNEFGALGVLNHMNIIGAGTEATIIDANYIDRVIFVVWDVNVSISGLTIRNGLSDQPGGGIYNNGHLTLNGVRIDSNTAGFYGGGIYSTQYYIGITDPSLTVSNSNIYNNHTDSISGSGGGIAIYAGELSLTDVTFDSNRAKVSGGGLWTISTLPAQLYRTKFTSNVATTGSGGNIFTSSPMSIERSSISTGSAGSEGGNIYSGQFGGDVPILTINDTEISGGVALNGGGIANYGQLDVVNTSIFNNGATGWGDGLYTKGTSSSVNLDHVTIAHNILSPNPYGSGIYNFDYNINLVVVHNSILDGVSGEVCFGAVDSTSSFNIDAGTSCSLSSAAGLHNLSSTDALLLPNANNGGFSQTMAITNNSPAVDAANSIGCPATDQRQVKRQIDGNGDGVNGCDIGAFELGSQIFISLVIK